MYKMGNKVCYHCKKEFVPGEERYRCDKCKRAYHIECLGINSELVKDEMKCLYCKKQTKMNTVFS